MKAKPPAIFLMGPTASGKTDLAVRLTRLLPCDIISVDSAMVYRGMDIGTAKPDAETLATAPHRLIDICDPSEAFSASRFRELAIGEMQDILARGRIPLLVGGTMLYFRALEQGLAPMPSADPELRRRLEAEGREQGWPALHARLAEVDPASAARIKPTDPQRIQRALEVYELSGEPMSHWFEKPVEDDLPCTPVKLILAPKDRDVLRARIALRFRQMLSEGLVEEVQRLYERGDLHPDLPSMRAVGYRQVWAYLAGDYDYETMVERGIIATRQFAKRQYTWLRHETGAARFESGDADLDLKVLKYLAVNAISEGRGGI